MVESTAAGRSQGRIRRTLIPLGIAALLTTIAAGVALAGEHKHDDHSSSKSKKCNAPLEECLEKMTRKLKTTGWIGVEINVDEKHHLYTIETVIPESPAEGAGIRLGDMLHAIDGTPIADFTEATYAKAMKSWKPGTPITFTIGRECEEIDISLIMAPMPAHVLAKYIGQHLSEHQEREEERASKREDN